MGDYTALAEVGESLVNVLWDEIKADQVVRDLIDNEERISLESPFDLRENGDVRLSIYMYRIAENPNTKNQFPVQGVGGQLNKPPLTLDLFYLVTPLVGSPREQQIILGKVMQVLYDRAILNGSDLAGSLASSEEEMRIILNPVNLEETTRIWQALEMSYRLSVCYTVRVAMLDSRHGRMVPRVVQKTAEYGEKV